MSYIDREVQRLSSKFVELGADSPLAPQLRAAIQALSWVLEPQGVAAPLPMILGTQEVPKDYSVHNHPQ